jgi:hypothetical protein
LLVNNGNLLVSQGHTCNVEVSRLFSNYEGRCRLCSRD